MSARKHTVRDYLIVALVARGATRVNTPITTHKAYELSEPNGVRLIYFVGRNGELRQGSSVFLKHSFPVSRSGWFFGALLDQGRSLLEELE